MISSIRVSDLSNHVISVSDTTDHVTLEAVSAGNNSLSESEYDSDIESVRIIEVSMFLQSC